MTPPIEPAGESPRTDAAISGVLDVERVHMSCLISLARSMERSLALKDAELETMRREGKKHRPLLKVAEAAIRQYEGNEPTATYCENKNGYGWYSELELAIDAAIRENEGRHG